MAWQCYPSQNGLYDVDWDGIYRIVRSYASSAAIRRNAKTREETHWIGPNLKMVEVDWAKVRKETDENANTIYADLYQTGTRSIGAVCRELHHELAATRRYKNEFIQMQRLAQHETMHNIEKSVHRGELGEKTARFVRDASAETLLVGAGFLSGGSALLVLGGGSLMKGGFSWQDDGKIGKAAITVGTSFVMGFVDLKVAGHLEHLKHLGKISGAEKFALGLIWAKTSAAFLEGPKALIEGKSIKEAVATGGIKLAGATPLESVKALLESNKRLQLIGVPALGIVSVLQDRASARVAEGPEQEQEPPEPEAAEEDDEELLDAAQFDNSFIEKMAIRRSVVLAQ